MINQGLNPLPARQFFRLLVKVFFRVITVRHVERIPSEGPLLLVANHVNSLLDPLLLYCAGPRPVRFLAKAPLFRHPLVAPFLKMMGALPVQRRMDAGADPSQNEATFEACAKLLASGEALALFPEGMSHDEPHLMPLKTGAARILCRAALSNVCPLIVPAGLVYDAKTTFRSDVAVLFGKPIPWDDLPWDDRDSPQSVIALTERITQKLRQLTLNAERWEDLHLVDDLYPLILESLGLEDSQKDRAAMEIRVLDSFYRFHCEKPAEMDALIKKAKHYLGLITMLNMKDEDVKREVTIGSAFSYTWRRLLYLTVGFPFAFLGWLFYAIPYALTGPLARLISPRDDTVATYKLYLGMVLFTFFMILEGLLLEWFTGLWFGVTAVLLSIPCAFWALSYYEARAEFFHVAWSTLSLGTRRSTAARLKKKRVEVSKAIRTLADQLSDAK